MITLSSSWTWPALAAILLWAPMIATLQFRKSGKAYRLSWAPRAKAILIYWANWVDLFRCALAMSILVGWGDAIRFESDESTVMVAATIIVITLVGFSLQTMLVQTRRAIFVPLPLVLSSAIFVPGWQMGLFVVLVGFSLCAVLRKFEMLFPILIVLLILVGNLLEVDLLDLTSSIILVVFPSVLAFVSRKHLVLPSRSL